MPADVAAIRAMLQEYNLDLPEIHDMSVDLRGGTTAANPLLLGHVVRELLNTLQRLLINDEVAGGGIDSKKARKHWTSLDAHLQLSIANMDQKDPDLVGLQTALAEFKRWLTPRFPDEGRKKRQISRALSTLIKERIREDDELVANWIGLHKRAMGHTHHPANQNKPDARLPEPAFGDETLDRFNELLTPLARKASDRMAEIDDIVEAANDYS